MVMRTPKQKKMIQKWQIELAWLNLKERLLGKLSEADQERRREILRNLGVKY